MADIKFSQFPSRDQLLAGDIVVGLSNDVPGLNAQFTSQVQQIASCRVYQGISLNATYNNGAAGVGATLTDASGTFVPLTVDGVTLTVGNRVVVNNQVQGFRNGIYALTTQGNNVNISWVLTRTTDFDEVEEITIGRYVFVEAGTIYAGNSFTVVEPQIATIGTDTIVFSDSFTFDGILAPNHGGTGLNNSANTLSITANSVINQNVSTTANPLFNTIAVTDRLTTDTNLGFAGTPITSLANAVNYVATNPLASYYTMGFTIPGLYFELPVMNDPDSLVEGRCIYIRNSGANPFNVVDNNINVIGTLQVGQMAQITVLSNASSFGPLQFDIINNTAVTPYIVGPGPLANYTTINDAIAQAIIDGVSSTNIKVIQLQPGTYTSSVFLFDGIVIVGPEAVCPKTYYQPSAATCQMSAVIFGQVYYSMQSVNADTYCSLQNVQVFAQGTSCLEVQCNSAFTQQLLIENCYVSSDNSGTTLLNMNEGNVVISNSVFADESVTQDVNFAFFNGGSGSSTLLINNSTIYASIVNNPITTQVGAYVNITVSDSDYYPLMDAANAGVYFFRADSIQHTINLNNLVPFHTVPMGCSGSIIYSNSEIYCNPGVTVASINEPNYLFIFNNGNFGLNGYLTSSDMVIGGNQTFYNSGFFSPNGSYVKNKLISGGFYGSDQFMFQGGVQTLDNTPTNLAEIIVNELESVTVFGTITGSDIAHTASVGGTFNFTAMRAAGGNITAVGVVNTNVNATTAGVTFTVIVDVGSQSVVIQVTGDPVATYNWVTTFQYQKILSDT